MSPVCFGGSGIAAGMRVIDNTACVILPFTKKSMVHDDDGQVLDAGGLQNIYMMEAKVFLLRFVSAGFY